MKIKSNYLSKEQIRKLKSKLKKKEIVKYFERRRLKKSIIVGFADVALAVFAFKLVTSNKRKINF